MDADTIITYLGYIVAILSTIISLYKSHKAGKTLAQALVVLANTLKDETKMLDGKFSPETLQKAEEMAMTIGANDVAVEEVKKALTGKELNLKLASWKGKPVYLSDLLKFGGIAQGIGKLFRK